MTRTRTITQFLLGIGVLAVLGTGTALAATTSLGCTTTGTIRVSCSFSYPHIASQTVTASVAGATVTGTTPSVGGATDTIGVTVSSGLANLIGVSLTSPSCVGGIFVEVSVGGGTTDISVTDDGAPVVSESVMVAPAGSLGSICIQ